MFHTQMTDGTSNEYASDEEHSTEEIRKREAIMEKLQKLIQEDDPEARKHLTHELTLEITKMMRKNEDMKAELLAFVRRLRR